MGRDFFVAWSGITGLEIAPGVVVIIDTLPLCDHSCLCQDRQHNSYHHYSCNEIWGRFKPLEVQVKAPPS